jgi:hypothetical protein
MRGHFLNQGAIGTVSVDHVDDAIKWKRASSFISASFARTRPADWNLTVPALLQCRALKPKSNLTRLWREPAIAAPEVN